MAINHIKEDMITVVFFALDFYSLPCKKLIMVVLALLTLFFVRLDAIGKVGTNLEGKSYYSPGITWKNRLYQSQPFKANGNYSLSLDSNGYVNSLPTGHTAHSLFMDALKDSNGDIHYPTPGLHVFLYDGDCSGCRFSLGSKTVNQSDGRWIVNFTASSTGQLDIDSIPNPSNYPHNFVLVPIEYESNYKTDPWDPSWLKPLQDTPFSSFRFMDFLQFVFSVMFHP